MARKPETYWEKRSTEIMDSYEKTSERTMFRLIKIYEQTQTNIENSIRAIYRNYSKDGKLTEEVLNALLNKEQTKICHDNLLKVIKLLPESDIRKKLLTKYNAPAYAYRISRLESLKMNVNAELIKLADIEEKVTKSTYKNIIEDGYYRTIYETQKGLGLNFGFDELDNKTINMLLNDKWYNKENFSERVWNNREKLSEYLSTNLISDRLSRKTVAQSARELSEAMNIGKFQATRLIRTETNHFANESEMLAYEECEIEKYRFIATLDAITCKHCARLDNKVFYVRERSPGVNYPPIHPFDRCTTVAEFDDENMEEMQRRARDPVTGKNYILDKNISYDEWKQQIDAKYGNGTLDLEHKKHVNLANDKGQLKRYKAVLGKRDELQSIEKFQDFKYNNSERYNYLKGYYRYQNEYPTSNEEYYQINNKIKDMAKQGVIKEGIGTALKPNTEGVKISTINDHAEKKMQERKITKDMAQSYIDNAIVEFSQNKKTLYISNEGATAILKEDKRLISTYNTFDEGIIRIMEVINGR